MGHPRELRTKCLSEFVAGKSLREIAKDNGLAYSTVLNWYNREHWKGARDKSKASVQENIIEKLTEQLVQNTTQHLDGSFLIGQIILERLYGIYQTKPDNSLEVCEDCAKILLMSANVMRLIHPSHREDVIEAAMNKAKGAYDPVTLTAFKNQF